MREFIKKHTKKLDSVLKYLVAAVLLAVPLYPKFPFINIPGTFVAIRLEDVLLGVLFIVWLIRIIPEYSYYLKSSVTRSVLLFLAIGLISLVSATLVTQTINPLVGLVHWIRRIEYFIPFFIGWHVIRSNPKQIGFFFKLYIIVIFISFVYGFGQKYFDFPIIITQNAEYSKGVALRWREGAHVNATFAGHYDLATYLVLIMPIILGAFFVLKGKWTKIILGTNFFAALWLLVNSASRISLVSYMMSACIGLFYLKRYKWIPVIIIISFLFIGFSSNLLMRYEQIFEVAKEKISAQIEDMFVVYAQEEAVLEDRSTSIRLNVEWPRAVRSFYKNPLLGTGYSSTTLATDNDYLRLVSEVGLLGFISFGIVLIQIATKILTVFPLRTHVKGWEKVIIAGFVGGVCGVLLNAVFIDVFEASKFAINFWFMAGFVVGLVDVYHEKNI